ncbi:hypothetical protein [Actinoalloteichus hymeniacidonis]|uniref:Uncharacterized protein n=1 Tax=Actinoalloteichus hymeniacidonis TaxID=340345 RepID=A0AAC9HNZ2_9PSEU|nr:hypothetical protein [Actinoalloteichus hymeniacidonis]AOS62693.1 hypothetical protein TL08_09390 [Actinoalloteichus hymeniacidonis]MBB5909276.1 hypothetical protein [Actinoalloteichus hymeniacidonis]
MLTTIVAVAALCVILVLVLLVIQARRAADRALAGRLPTDRGAASSGTAGLWHTRGRRAIESLEELTRSRPELSGVRADAEAVLAELRDTAHRVAVLDEVIASVPSPELAASRDRLAASAASSGEDERAEILDAVRAVDHTLESDRRRRAVRDALLAEMHATVTGLEAAALEVREWVSPTDPAMDAVDREYSMPSDQPAMPADRARERFSATPQRSSASVELAERLQGLREGLVEVRRLPDRGSPPAQGKP